MYDIIHTHQIIDCCQLCSHQAIVFGTSACRRNTHLIATFPNIITSHDSFQSPRCGVGGPLRAAIHTAFGEFTLLREVVSVPRTAWDAATMSLAIPTRVVRGNHLSNTTCLTHALFKSGEDLKQLQLVVLDK